MSKLSEKEFYIYTAGFFDGEGCFTINKQIINNKIYYHPQIFITQCDKRPLEIIKEKINIPSYIRPLYTNNILAAYIFNIRKIEDCILFINKILPYVIVKKEVLELGREFCKYKLKGVKYDYDDNFLHSLSLKIKNQNGSVLRKIGNIR